jgi:hypothetical protein
MSEATEEREQEAPHGEALQTARRAATGALVAGLVGGLAGAAKVLRDRHAAQEHDDENDDEAHDDESPEPEASATEVEEDEDADVEPTADDDDRSDGEPADAGEEAPDESGEGDDEDDDARAEQPGGATRGSAGHGNAAQAVEAARGQLERLLGSDSESVSAVERGDDGWKVTLEVVEVRRIPDSTDVLSSYEVVLDDDNDIVRLNRTRRYRRGQVEDGG